MSREFYLSVGISLFAVGVVNLLLIKLLLQPLRKMIETLDKNSHIIHDKVILQYKLLKEIKK